MKATAESKHKHTLREEYAGFTLIEVLIALVLFSIGILGVIGLQATALNLSTSAEDSTRAALLANEIVSTMQNNNTVNLDAVDASLITDWKAKVKSELPSGSGDVTVNGSVATITITWSEAQLKSGSKLLGSTHTYTTAVNVVTIKLN